MPLTIGTRLGPFEVVGQLGAGGMGEVYRARDATLNRDVALKILSPAFAGDAERLARFEREAQVLASLNHPNIAHIYGLERQDGRDGQPGSRALVLELVEGPTLGERIEQGPMPLDESLAIARQIAEALEAAHEQGIVHRDLKPANVKVRADGTVKVLDFGLAKALEVTTSGGPSSVSMSPTLTAATQLGVILGTAAYMAPEQARGKAVDKRADIWAFGAVLYEMLSGRRAFAGEEVSDTLAFVITKEIEWSALPADTPPHIRRLLRRCLEKDPKRRLRDIGDARVELEARTPADDSAVTPSTVAAAPKQSVARRVVPWAAGLAAGTAITAAIAWNISTSRPVVARPPQRFPITIPASVRFVGELGGELAISPDGTRLVYPAFESGKRLLYLRNLDQLESQPIRGTDDAYNPFFSPDGEWIGFFTAGGTSAGRLKKIAVRGGPPLTLTETSVPSGVWTTDESIIFTRSDGQPWSLFRIPAAGGTATRLTTPAADRKEVRHGWPDLLPDGTHVLFSITTNGLLFDQAHVAVLSLDTGTYQTVIEQGYQARYVRSGHIVYALAGNLMAVPFDVQRLVVTGPPVPIVEGVRGRTNTGEAIYGVSPTGFLVYAPGGTTAVGAQREIVWVDRAGKEERLTAPRRAYGALRLSPDSTRIAVHAADQESDIWVWDLARSSLTRLTFDPATDSNPVWTPDGKRIIFASSRSGSPNLYWQAADGTGQPERLIESPTADAPTSVSPDGTQLLYVHADPKRTVDIHALPLIGSRRPTPIIHTAFVELNAEVSPDGRWLAYQSNESGGDEVYVRPFPNADSGRWQVSVGGGRRPLWSHDRRELFYTAEHDALTRVMSAPVSTAGAFSAGAPRMLFEGRFYAPAGGGLNVFRTYDVSPDGKRFLMIRELESNESAASAPPLVAILNFFDELKRLAPPKR